MKRMVAFLFCSEEKEFKKWFVDEFLKAPLSFQGIQVTFAEDDFLHICFEAGSGGVSKSKFGIRRARRLLLLKQLLTEEIPSDLLYEDSSGNYCLLCEPLDIAVFLIPIRKTKTLQIGTIIHYGEGFTKAIEKQRKKCKPMKKIIFI